MSDMRSGGINWADMMDTGQKDGSVETVFSTEKVAPTPIAASKPKGMGVEVMHTEEQQGQMLVSSDSGPEFVTEREWVSGRLPEADEVVDHGGYFRIQQDGIVKTATFDAYDKEWFIFNQRAGWVKIEGEVVWLKETFPVF